MLLHTKAVFGILFFLLFLFFTDANAQHQEQDSSKIALSKTSDSLWYENGDKDFNLILAADTGDIKAALFLLNHGASINAVTPEGVTPLMYAAQRGNLEMVKLLLLNGADINLTNYNGESALIGAAVADQEDVCNYLIQQGAVIDSSDNKGTTPLMHAAAGNFYYLADMLLYYGAKIDQVDHEGNSAMMIAAYQNSIDVASLLHKHQFNVNLPDRHGNTPLMAAAQQGFLQMTDSLVLWGAQVNARNENEYSALALAIRNNQLQTAETLIRAGADVNSRIRTGLRPIDLARHNPSMDSLLRINGAKSTMLPDYSQIITGLNISWNFHDYTNGLFAGMYDTKYRSSITVGFMTRMLAKNVLVEKDPFLYYQYWERRYMVWAGIDKQFVLFTSPKGAKAGITLGFKEGFTFGNYRGSKTKTQRQFLFIPLVGISRTGKLLTASIGYEYSPFPVYGLSPHRIQISLRFHFPFKHDNYNNKSIRWLNN